ncbi:MAG: hypothetical protein AAB847_01350 [Patescibacteria group bacterium]
MIIFGWIVSALAIISQVAWALFGAGDVGGATTYEYFIYIVTALVLLFITGIAYTQKSIRGSVAISINIAQWIFYPLWLITALIVFYGGVIEKSTFEGGFLLAGWFLLNGFVFLPLFFIILCVVALRNQRR